MHYHLQKLSSWLKKANKILLAQQITDLMNKDDYMIEDIENRLKEEPVSEDIYFEENFEPSLQKFIEFNPELVDIRDAMSIAKKQETIEELKAEYEKTKIDIKELYETYEKILKIEGFKLIDSSKDSPLLGQGAYGIVFRGIYQGKPAVAKIEIVEPTYSDNQDVKNWQRILEIKNEISPQLQKHIPEVYKSKEGVIDGKKYQIIIMEELKPLSDYMKSKLNNIVIDFNSPQKIYILASKIHKNLEGTVLEHIKKEDVFRRLLETKINREAFVSHFKVPNKYQSILVSAFNEAMFEIKTDFKNVKFPRNSEYTDYIYLWQDEPETQNFIRLLQTLKDNYNLSWADMHLKNIMEDDDGNLKIMDIGQWK